jgi:hypothetical protein
MVASTPDSPFMAECYRLTGGTLKEALFFTDTLSDGASNRLFIYIRLNRNTSWVTIETVVQSIVGLLLVNSKVLPAACKVLK